MDNQKSILIADNETAVTKILADALVMQGYRVQVVEDGEAAWHQTKELRPDLILLEVMLPKLSGFEFLKQLRKHKQFKATPVIVLSNLSQPADIEEAHHLGVTDYLVKSNHTIQAITERIAQAL